MRRVRLLCGTLFLLAANAGAQWTAVSTQSEMNAGVEHRHVVLADATSNAEATFDLALFSARASTLRLIDNPSRSQDLSAAMAQDDFVAGVNGGYFDPNFKPLGLRVSAGETRSPLTHARLLTGILCASGRSVDIVRVGQYSRGRKVDFALECGPVLVERALAVATLESRRSARRTFAAVDRDGRAALGVASDMTLAQLASALSHGPIANDFKVWKAMNLDGGSSSAFWFRRKDGSVFSISEDKMVRDFIAVTRNTL